MAFREEDCSFIFISLSLYPLLGLTDNCRDCATHCLQFLKELKLKATLQRAEPSAIRYTVQRILNQATVSVRVRVCVYGLMDNWCQEDSKGDDAIFIHESVYL